MEDYSIRNKLLARMDIKKEEYFEYENINDKDINIYQLEIDSDIHLNRTKYLLDIERANTIYEDIEEEMSELQQYVFSLKEDLAKLDEEFNQKCVSNSSSLEFIKTNLSLLLSDSNCHSYDDIEQLLIKTTKYVNFVHERFNFDLPYLIKQDKVMFDRLREQYNDKRIILENKLSYNESKLNKFLEMIRQVHIKKLSELEVEYNKIFHYHNKVYNMLHKVQMEKM